MASFKFRLPAFRDLTRDQKRAVNSDDPIIVTGVPGCGKTVVSIHKYSDNFERRDTETQSSDNQYIVSILSAE